MNKVEKEEKELRRKMKLKKLNGTYQYNEEKRAVTYFIVSKGEIITGTAKCNAEDEFDRSVGEQIAYRRAHLKQRNRDLILLREFIEDIKDMVEAYKEENLIYSKHYEIAIMNACEEEQSQLDQIRTLECEISELIEFGKVLTKQARAEMKLGRPLEDREHSEIECYGYVLTDKQRAKVKAAEKRQAIEAKQKREAVEAKAKKAKDIAGQGYIAQG